jgi:hypothetical protein
MINKWKQLVRLILLDDRSKYQAILIKRKEELQKLRSHIELLKLIMYIKE